MFERTFTAYGNEFQKQIRTKHVQLSFHSSARAIDTSVISAALVLLYLKEESIYPCIVVHGINDALAFLIFPLLG